MGIIINKAKVNVLILVLFATLFANASPQQNVNDYIIFQDGIEKTVPVYNGVITLERDAFSIRFYNKKYNIDKKETYDVKLAGFINEREWNKVKSGLEVEKSPFFDGGSAYAVTQEGAYNGFFFSDGDDDYLGGSHHLVYGHPELKTALLLKKAGDHFKLEFKVEYLFIKEQLVKVADTRLSEFYIALVNDTNLDGIVDEDELTKVVIKLK